MTGTTLEITRSTDLDFVRRFAAGVRPGEPYILNVYGIRGAGKTELMRRTFDSCRHERPTALADVKAYFVRDDPVGYRLDELVLGIREDFLRWEPDVSIGSTRDVAGLAQDVLNIMRVFDDDMPPLLLIDAYDQLPPGLQKVFQDLVLGPMARVAPHSAAVLTSYHPLRFADRLDLRMRTRPHQLDAIDEDDVSGPITRLISGAGEVADEIAEEIMEFTGGLPVLLERVIEWARERKITTPEAFRAQRGALFGENYGKLAHQTILPEGSSEQLGTALDTLALLRRFDVALLARLLPRINPAQFAGFTQKNYLDLIGSLGSSVSWQPSGGYVLNDTVKNMLFHYLRAFNQPFFQKVNADTAQVYSEWVLDSFRPHLVQELLYHRMILASTRGDDAGSTREILTEALIEAVRRAMGHVKPADIDTLEKALTQDGDLLPYFTDPDLFDMLRRDYTGAVA